MINQIDVIDLVRTKAKLKVCNGNVRKVNHQAETEEQAALIEWADKTVIDGICIGDYLIHIPNEGKRGPKAARDAKRLGLLKGGPDLFLALPRGGCAGLWIEMNALYGKPTVYQQQWIERMKISGYHAVVCKRFEKTKKIIELYNM
ncbi:VRR-NUC domain-containing protein [Yersinia enterocolitica]|uniref:VRR-NUC domain-containing protein n=1 Tax=Yersinia enterocolitica TaxID=630 RepID=UPI002155BEE6|nr:VRR-NUC domain-containing protein [Yersinia enterocolitica]ELI8124639.1 VRR-NUC domain-containing protein [Yersinia enterocolitica]MBW5820545.1 VRR-NUC domain-containing protein [Yersinia enterocolitica]HDL7186901.1 VRR-NUC domain-containing protein [Yersinia enterocolitica]HDL7189627.1 VRR-NUC domain-containing protein [Yersinia enterocolitica]HEN5446838.1 VRR-NUC domain-containing protein [Yersinia enterocolitica]